MDYYVKTQDTNLTSEDKKVKQERCSRGWLPAAGLTRPTVASPDCVLWGKEELRGMVIKEEMDWGARGWLGGWST